MITFVLGTGIFVTLLGVLLYGAYASQRRKQEPLTKPRPNVRRVK